MNEQIQSHDPLEEELAALQPRELTNGFVERLGLRLAEPTHRDEPPQPQRFGLARLWAPGLAVAAAILIAICLLRNEPPQDVPAPRNDTVADPIVEPGEQPVRQPRNPTLIAYSQAIGNPQSDLDDLLDYHARTLLPRVPDPVASIR